MTPEEVFNHNWQKGETIYAIVCSYGSINLNLKNIVRKTRDGETFSPVIWPECVVKATVNNIESTKFDAFYEGDTCKEYYHIDFTIEDYNNEFVYGDDKLYIVIHRHAKTGEVIKIEPNFNENHIKTKFFNKEDAEAYITVIKNNINKEYAKCIKKLKKEKSEIENRLKYIETEIDGYNKSIDIVTHNV